MRVGRLLLTETAMMTARQDATEHAAYTAAEAAMIATVTVAILAAAAIVEHQRALS